MFPKVPPLSLLERKIDRHMKDSDDKLKLFKSELEFLKSSSKRPSTAVTKARAKQPEAAQKAVTTTTAKSKGDEKKSVSTSTTPKASKKAVNFFRQLGAFPRSSILIASPHLPQFVQHHPNDDEMKDERTRLASIYSTASCGSTDTAMTSISCCGNSTRINCSPLKLLQFLVVDLRTKLKDFVPDGNTRPTHSTPTI